MGEGVRDGEGGGRPPLVLVIGGARSGKSGYAERLAAGSGRPVVYVATARDWGDPEMADRIAAHKAARPAQWRTVEAPLLDEATLARLVGPSAPAGADRADGGATPGGGGHAASGGRAEGGLAGAAIPAAAASSPGASRDPGGAGPVVLVDCLTLWLTNVMIAEPAPDDAAIEARSAALARAVGRRAVPVVMVSNEVGEGIVPESALGRRFRDHQGRLNQWIARAATDVVRLVAGCPLVVKPAPEPDIRL